MFKSFEDSDLVWDSNSGKWVKPNEVKREESEKEFSVEVETVHFSDYLKNTESLGNGRIFKSHFSSFDEQLEGIETGEVVVISGHAKNGKTLFAESWLKSLMLKDPTCKTLFFSFEVKTRKLLMKYLEYESLPLYVPLVLKTMDFNWLYRCCKHAKEVNGVSIALIDHMHFMVDMNTKQNMSLNIGAFMRRLKQDIAIGLDMAVILIAHQGQAEKGKEASVYSIRDSSFVAQEADSVIVVSRRKNLDPVEFIDFRRNYGDEKADKVSIKDNAFIEDEYSQGLCVVSIERARRSGVFEYKKLFKKTGHFMEEI